MLFHMKYKLQIHNKLISNSYFKKYEYYKWNVNIRLKIVFKAYLNI